jgi:hypothetical protein
MKMLRGLLNSKLQIILLLISYTLSAEEWCANRCILPCLNAGNPSKACNKLCCDINKDNYNEINGCHNKCRDNCDAIIDFYQEN